MTYCSQADLEDRYGPRLLTELTDRGDVATGTIDSDVVDRAIADTDALIDGYLAGRYALPLSETPSLLTDLAQQIAVYKLHLNVASEKITADYRDAIKTLTQISKGEVRLSVSGAEPDGGAANEVRTNEPERPFTNDSMKGFI